MFWKYNRRALISLGLAVLLFIGVFAAFAAGSVFHAIAFGLLGFSSLAIAFVNGRLADRESRRNLTEDLKKVQAELRKIFPEQDTGSS